MRSSRTSVFSAVALATASLCGGSIAAEVSIDPVTDTHAHGNPFVDWLLRDAWEATTLEWQTPDTPPKHGNFGPELPSVYRWAYDYGVPGAEKDYIPQNVSPSDLKNSSGQ